MNWVTTKLLSSAMQAGVSVVDSHLLSKRVLDLRFFMLVMGIMQALYSLLLYVLNPWPTDLPFLAVLAIIAASISGTTATLITFYILQKEEVSRVVPIGHTSPVFVAIIATLFLDESLNYLHWLAIIIIVIGAMMISAEKRQSVSSIPLKRPFSLLFLSSLLAALGNVFAKYALDYVSFWNMYSMAIVGTATIFLAISTRPDTLRYWKEMKRRGSTLTFICLNEVAALSASVLHIRAVSLGPVSLVSAIGGVRPLLVVAYSMILSLVLPGFLLELPDKRTMVLRVAAIIMIIGGVSMITLN